MLDDMVMRLYDNPRYQPQAAFRRARFWRFKEYDDQYDTDDSTRDIRNIHGLPESDLRVQNIHRRCVEHKRTGISATQ